MDFCLRNSRYSRSFTEGFFNFISQHSLSPEACFPVLIISDNNVLFFFLKHKQVVSYNWFWDQADFSDLAHGQQNPSVMSQVSIKI